MRRLATRYLLVQGFVVLAWWAWLCLQPSARGWFFPPAATLEWRTFLLPDVVLMVGASLLAAWARSARRPWAAAASWFVAGAVAYAALFTLHWTWWAPVPGCAAAAMVGAALASFACALQPV